jgi:hypothetical protein
MERPELMHGSDYQIIHTYGSEYRGIVQYYLMAENLTHFTRLRWVSETSMLLTLARKHRSTVKQMARKFKTIYWSPSGRFQACFKVVVEREGKDPLVAWYGNLSLRPQSKPQIFDDPPQRAFSNNRTELVSRLLADECELCGSCEDVEVHHVRALKDLKKRGRREMPLWKQRLCAFKRKTLVLCRKCHAAIHAGRPTGSPTD